MNPVVLITTCKKNINRISCIEASWALTLKNKNIPYYYITSDNLDSVPLLKLKNFVESYEQLPTKTFLALEEISKSNFSHIIKVDDDTFLDFNKILPHIFEYDYVGKFNEVSDAPTIHYYKCKDEFRKPKKPAPFVYAEGGFYILSKKAVKQVIERPISEFINTPDNYRGEDVIVGSILSSSEFKKLDLCDKKQSKKYNMDITTNYTSIHPVHHLLMAELYSSHDKDKILVENAYKNDYNKRDIFLKLYAK
jgi:hypothetical protein